MAETDYPLLLFPEPVQAGRARRFGGGGKLKTPDSSTQGERMAPQFQRLQDAMERHRLSLQDNPLGLQPEQVLVLETIGSIDQFFNAVRHVEGFEWMKEYSLDDIPPEHGFQDEKEPEKNLKSQIFLVVTDQQALTQLKSLFDSWKRNPDMRFDRGLAPLKKVFAHLYTIRPWGIKDRIEETGVLDDWRDRLERKEEDNIPFEAELWFRKHHSQREAAESYLRSLIESDGGRVLKQCVIHEIEYHAVLGYLPRDWLRDILGTTDDIEKFKAIKLLQCEGVMYARPVGQCGIRLSDGDDTEPLTDDELADTTRDLPTPNSPPVIALFDGMPLTQHRLLQGRLRVDDPDGYETTYQANARMHGTEMASLMCHGDLNKPGKIPERVLYVRPILQPRRGFAGQFDERIPENALPVDLIHRAVRRLFERENSEPPAAPTIRIINLSVCDQRRHFIREMSSLARLLDWLAWKYGILFIISAGNHVHALELEIPRANFNSISPHERERAVIKFLAKDTRHRRLLSPAESLNGLTVGAAHEDASPPPIGSVPPIDPFESSGLPSVISAHGPGYRRAVKPEIFFPGGRQFVTEKPGNSHTFTTLQINSMDSPPGQRVATPGNAGQLNRTRYIRGTSNAAAMASRGAGFIYDLLSRLRAQPVTNFPPEYDVVLTKALLVHGASWENSKSRYEDALKDSTDGRTLSEYVGHFLGYGTANLAKVMTCTEQRVTVLGFGELENGAGAEFTFPLPPSLSSVKVSRRLTITLAWFSPVRGGSQAYRIAHLWFDPKNELASKRQFAQYQAVQRGTVQHEVLEGDNAVAFQDGENIKIKINCRADAGDIGGAIRYGLAVTLEVAEGENIPIYQEVRSRLPVPLTV